MRSSAARDAPHGETMSPGGDGSGDVHQGHAA